jgi:taurine dioxygenase
MQTVNIRHIGYALGSQVTGVDLSAPLDDELVTSIRQACLDRMVLCFPGQNIEAPAFKAFCARFGELDDNRGNPFRRHPDDPTVMILSNKPVTVKGSRSGAGGVAGIASLWHSDLAYTERPSTFTFLAAKRLPEVGGNTMFANMSMAYDALSPGLRAMIDPLGAVHDAALGTTFARSEPEIQAQIKRLNPPVVHPVVRVHPETGLKALYIGTRVRNFVGLTPAETSPLLDFLNRHATRPEFIYRHRWNPNDVVMWDNRSVMHYAVPDFDLAQLRQMLRCSLVGPKIGRIYTDRDEADSKSLAAPQEVTA